MTGSATPEEIKECVRDIASPGPNGPFFACIMISGNPVLMFKSERMTFVKADGGSSKACSFPLGLHEAHQIGIILLGMSLAALIGVEPRAGAEIIKNLIKKGADANLEAAKKGGQP